MQHNDGQKSIELRVIIKSKNAYEINLNNVGHRKCNDFVYNVFTNMSIAACFLCSSQYQCIEFTKKIKLYGLKFKMCDAAMNMLARTTVSNCKCVYFQL